MDTKRKFVMAFMPETAPKDALNAHKQIYDVVLELLDLHKISSEIAGICMANILVDLMHTDGFCKDACIDYFTQLVEAKEEYRELFSDEE